MGDKMIDCPKFVEMKKMFQGKNASNSKWKAIVEVKTITADVNVKDINVISKAKIIEE
jgi:hypothetical protein